MFKIVLLSSEIIVLGILGGYMMMLDVYILFLFFF